MSNSKHGVVHGSKAVPIPTRQVTASKACTNTPSGSSSANVPASAILDIKAANGPCVTNGGAVNVSAVSDKLLSNSVVHASLRRTGGATHYATFQDDAFTSECGVADMESQAYYPTKSTCAAVKYLIECSKKKYRCNNCINVLFC